MTTDFKFLKRDLLKKKKKNYSAAKRQCSEESLLGPDSSGRDYKGVLGINKEKWTLETETTQIE